MTKEATIENVIIGYPLYGDMTWSVTSVQSVVNFYIHQCELVDSNANSVKFIRNNCYSSALGAANLQSDKLVGPSSQESCKIAYLNVSLKFLLEKFIFF